MGSKYAQAKCMANLVNQLYPKLNGPGTRACCKLPAGKKKGASMPVIY